MPNSLSIEEEVTTVTEDKTSRELVVDILRTDIVLGKVEVVSGLFVVEKAPDIMADDDVLYDVEDVVLVNDMIVELALMDECLRMSRLRRYSLTMLRPK